uniref:uncharacterized protein n=1 Tax=Pristiophorus japonicus TaxID=55135 RepID=UPI00398F573C
MSCGYLLQKKLSKNRAEQRRTGGGPPVMCELTDIEERALALVGIHNHSSTRAAAEPDVMPPQPRAQSLPTAPRQGDDPEAASAVDRASGVEEPRISAVELQVVLSTDDSEELEEPAATSSRSSTPITFSAPAAMSSSIVEVAGPSTLLQGTPSVSMPAPTSRRLVRHSRTAPRSADLSGDMVHLSKRNVDIGQQILQTMGGISQQLGTISANMTEYMP